MQTTDVNRDAVVEAENQSSDGSVRVDIRTDGGTAKPTKKESATYSSARCRPAASTWRTHDARKLPEKQLS